MQAAQWGYLGVIISPFNAPNKNITWTSGDESVVTIDQYGKYTGIKAGTAVITVTTEDGDKNCHLHSQCCKESLLALVI